MMDAISAPTVPATSPVVQQSASGIRADEGQDGSFSKALSNSGNQEKGPRLNEDDGADGADGATETGQETTAEVATNVSPKRPVIELSSIKTAAADTASSALSDISTDELSQLLAAARSKTTETKTETATTEEVTTGADTTLKAELSKALTGLRDKKSGSEEETADVTAATDETPKDDANGADITDALRLLAGATLSEVTADNESVDSQGTDDKVVGDHKTHAALSDAVASTVTTSAENASTSGEDKSDGERSFRIVRADGKGEPMILQNEGSVGAEETGDSSTVETVTVIDARRYIAPVSTTNAASITAAMLGDTEWVSAMSPGSELANAATQSSHGKVVNTLKLQMSPIELGSVTATLRLSGEELSVQLTVDNPAALRQLQNDTSDILKGLRAQGLTIDHVQVNMQVQSTERSADTGQSGTTSQQSEQQTFQSGGQGSDGRTRDEGTSNSTRMVDERLVQQTDVQTSDVRAARSGQLYV